jgi:hypothetical protein
VIDESALAKFGDTQPVLAKNIPQRFRNRVAANPVWISDNAWRSLVRAKPEDVIPDPKASNTIALPFIVKPGKSDCFTFSNRAGQNKLLEAAKWAIPFGSNDIPSLVFAMLFGPHYEFPKCDQNVFLPLASLCLYIFYELDVIDRHVFMKMVKSGRKGILAKKFNDKWFGAYVHFLENNYTIVPFGRPHFWRTSFVPTNGMISCRYWPGGCSLVEIVKNQKITHITASDELVDAPQENIYVFGVPTEEYDSFLKEVNYNVRDTQDL